MMLRCCLIFEPSMAILFKQFELLAAEKRKDHFTTFRKNFYSENSDSQIHKIVDINPNLRCITGLIIRRNVASSMIF